MSEKAAGKPKSTGKKSGSSSKSKSGGSSHLVRQSKANKVVTEEELKKKDVITPEDVMALTGATKGNVACFVHSTRLRCFVSFDPCASIVCACVCVYYHNLVVMYG